MERGGSGPGKYGLRAARTAVVLLVLLSLTVPSTVFFADAARVVEERIVLRNDGVAQVTLKLLLEEGLNEVPLPADPIPTTILVNLSGRLIPPLYVNGTLYVPSEAPGEATIEYLARLSLENGVAVFTVDPRGEAVLVVEPRVVLLTIPANITGYRVEDGTLYITFTGKTTIRYTLLEQPVQPSPAPTATGAVGETTPAPAATPAQQTAATPQTPQPATPTTPGAQPQQQAAGEGLNTILVAAVIAVVAAVILAEAVIIARRRRATASEEVTVEEPSRLDDTDYAILRQIQAAGGEVLQSQLQKQLGLPKTTLWRRIRKLESLGYIRVYREGKTNRIVLVRSPDAT